MLNLTKWLISVTIKKNIFKNTKFKISKILNICDLKFNFNILHDKIISLRYRLDSANTFYWLQILQ